MAAFEPSYFSFVDSSTCFQEDTKKATTKDFFDNQIIPFNTTFEGVNFGSMDALLIDFKQRGQVIHHLVDSNGSDYKEIKFIQPAFFEKRNVLQVSSF